MGQQQTVHPPMLVHRFGRFVHRQDPMLIARIVAFKRGQMIERAV